MPKTVKKKTKTKEKPVAWKDCSITEVEKRTALESFRLIDLHPYDEKNRPYIKRVVHHVIQDLIK